MADDIESRIYAFIEKQAGTFVFKSPQLTAETDLDIDMHFAAEEAEQLMNEFFAEFDVARGRFSLHTYYPPDPPLKELLNPFNKRQIPVVPDFTIGMLIESAKAGRWLYD